MLQTAQPKPKQTSSGGGAFGGKITLGGKAQTQRLVQSIAKQIAQEPIEIVKGAAEQIIGGAPPAETPQSAPDAQASDAPDVDVSKIRRREVFHMQAFREELQEIAKLQKERGQKFQQEKAQAEQTKQQEEAQKTETPPVEAPGKAPKKGGMMRGLKNKASNMLESFKFKKQRGIETQKMPSN